MIHLPLKEPRIGGTRLQDKGHASGSRDFPRIGGQACRAAGQPGLRLGSLARRDGKKLTSGCFRSHSCVRNRDFRAFLNKTLVSVDVAASHTARMLYEMIGIVSLASTGGEWNLLGLWN